MVTYQQQGILDDLGLTDLINKYGKSLAPIAAGLIMASAGGMIKNYTIRTALTIGGVGIAGFGAYQLYKVMYPNGISAASSSFPISFPKEARIKFIY